MMESTKQMLEALTKSANPMTADHAKAILAGREVPMRDTYYSAEELAATGVFGGFLKAVMMGNQRDAWLKADTLNQEALSGVIDRNIKNGIDCDDYL